MSRSNMLLGLVLMALGAVFLLGQLDVLEAGPTIGSWWPTIVIATGIIQATTEPRNIAGGLVIAAIGAILLLWRLDVIDGVAILWPVLLIAFGLWLLVGRGWPSYRAGESALDVFTLFGERDETPAGPFPGGQVLTVFGDVDLDLRRAEPVDSEVTLQVTTVFGDVDVDVPSEWEVRVSGPEVFGAVNIRGEPAPVSPAAILTLRVVTVFGDLTVTRHASSRNDR